MPDPRQTQEVTTSAPVPYDGFSTTTVDVIGWDQRRGTPVRIVTIENRDMEWQLDRYASGSYPAHTDPEHVRALVEFRDWKTDSPGRDQGRNDLARNHPAAARRTRYAPAEHAGRCAYCERVTVAGRTLPRGIGDDNGIYCPTCYEEYAGAGLLEEAPDPASN